AIGEALARDGADVAVVDLDVTRAQETAQAVSSQGRRALVIKANVAEWAEVAAMADRVLTELGRIDILVNNAGITRDSLLLRMKEEDWNAVLDVNLKGTFHCTKAVLPAMTRQRSGAMVNIASVVGVMGNAGQANYAASKAAVIGLTKTVAREYASRGVTGNAAAIGERVEWIVGERLGVEEDDVVPDAKVVEDRGADCWDTVGLVMAFEEAFGIEIPDEKAEKILTGQDAVDYIKENI